MPTVHSYTLGTHNLLDEKGVVTLFADIILFTEAVPARIIDKVKAQAARLRARLSGYRVIICKEQPDLVVLVRRKFFKVEGKSYKLIVKGWAGVTPHRGTFIVYLVDRRTGHKIVVVIEHRINAAFKPWIRGEKLFRIKSWREHTEYTVELIGRLKDSGYEVAAGGDLNTPEGVSGYEGSIHERGSHFDRLGSSGRIGHVVYLSKMNSDHPRLRAEVFL